MFYEFQVLVSDFALVFQCFHYGFSSSFQAGDEDFWWDVDVDGEVWLESVFVDFLYPFSVEVGGSLVGYGRVEVAVADYDFALFQKRLYFPFNVV